MKALITDITSPSGLVLDKFKNDLVGGILNFNTKYRGGLFCTYTKRTETDKITTELGTIHNPEYTFAADDWIISGFLSIGGHSFQRIEIHLQSLETEWSLQILKPIILTQIK